MAIIDSWPVYVSAFPFDQTVSFFPLFNHEISTLFVVPWAGVVMTYTPGNASDTTFFKRIAWAFKVPQNSMLIFLDMSSM